MRGLLVVLFSSLLVCQSVRGQATTPVPTRPILPPPPPPPPNSPPNFDRDNNDDDKAGQTTRAPQPAPMEPIQVLIDTGGADLIVNIDFKSFQSAEEYKFQTTMSSTCNDYCSTKGNCVGDNDKIVSGVDVVVYQKEAVKSTRTEVSFYIKNPVAFTQLTMTSKQLLLMFEAKRSEIEEGLGYRLDLGDLDGFVPFSNGLALDSWIIALLALIGLVIIVVAFVCFVNYRNKKNDTRMTFDDIEMQEESKDKAIPNAPAAAVAGDSPKEKVKVDVTTNVYEAEIIAETKHGASTTEPQTEIPPEEGGNTPGQTEPPASPNAIVVVADVSSSNEGSSVSSGEDPTSPASVDNTPPPDYEQAIQDDETKATSKEEHVTDEPPAASTEDQELPPPPEPIQAGEIDSTSATSADLPPPPPPDEVPINAETSPAMMSEIDEATGEKANLITDKSKVAESEGGLDNAGFETVINEQGEPSTEL